MSGTLVAVKDLRVLFQGVAALDGVTLAVAAGERRALIGPNGAGKTTLFNVLDGSIAPTTGRVELFGADVHKDRPHVRARRGLSRTYQITNLLSELSVLENVMLAVAGTNSRRRWTFWRPLMGMADVGDRASELLRRWDLWGERNRMVVELAYGQQRVLEIVMALASEPEVLLLDEPTAGLARAEADLLTDVAAALPRSLALIVIEHDMEVAFKLGEIVTVLAAGAIIAEGPPEEIRRSQLVIDTYLGEHDDVA